MLLIPARQKFPLFISQDGTNRAVAKLAQSFRPHVMHIQHIEADNFPTRKPGEPIAYYRIASHYKFVMRQIFDCWQYPKLVILEVQVTRIHFSCICNCRRCLLVIIESSYVQPLCIVHVYKLTALTLSHTVVPVVPECLVHHSASVSATGFHV